MLSAGGRALRSQFSLLWDSLQHLGARGQRCSYSPHPITQPRDPSSDQRGCSSGCLQMVWDEKRSFHRRWEGGDGARWEFSLCRGNPCVVSRDTGTGGSPASPAPVGSTRVGSSPGEAGEKRAGRASSLHFLQVPRLLSVLGNSASSLQPAQGRRGSAGGSWAVNLGSGHVLLVARGT